MKSKNINIRIYGTIIRRVLFCEGMKLGLYVIGTHFCDVPNRVAEGKYFGQRGRK
jgi:hypothetical protein